MDLTSFRLTVDDCPDGIAACREDLYMLIKNSFSSGHQIVWQQCRRLRSELIQKHVIDGDPLDPYFSVLERLQDAIRTDSPHRDEIKGNWSQAIRYARVHASLQSWGMSEDMRERMNRRDFEVAMAAKRILNSSFKLIRTNGDIFFEPESEARLVTELERLIISMGGLNVARRIFHHISPRYDSFLERYHLVRQSSPIGEGSPQIPFGYLLLLAVKHPIGRKPLKNADENWQQLIQLATDYAAVLDVQGYTPAAWGNFDAKALLPYLQELAIYDTMFCIPQIRGSDVVGLISGLLDGLDLNFKYGSGWSINEVLAVIATLLESSRDRRGPFSIDLRALSKACPSVAPMVILKVLKEVLSHPISGANQKFLKPTDAPLRDAPELKDDGHDFFKRPLLTIDGRNFILFDRAMCTPACLEALLAPLRLVDKKFDEIQLGKATERFLQAEFRRHGIPTLTGKYHASGEDGECDLVVETAQTVFFFEIKKKSLTRRARAGSDAHVLSDLASSLLKAQVQAGGHERRLIQDGFIDVEENGARVRVELKGRQIERIAVTLLDYGSFQDRILLKQFLEGNLNAEYSVSDPGLQKSFKELNASLAELRQQVAAFSNGKEKINQPFFNCWFLSVPQLLVLLDGVQGADEFKASLWQTRHISTSSFDLYFDIAYMRKLKASVPTTTEKLKGAASH